MKNTLIEFYLDWVNNYLSVIGMADAYELPFEAVISLIELGGNLHDEESRKEKSK